MSEPTHIGAILGLRDACEHRDAELSLNEANNSYGMYCHTCRSWVTKQLGFDRPWLGKAHPALAGKDLARVPVVGRSVFRKCQGPCRSLTHCEYHHLAPRKFFADADEWPTAWLCRPCHERWHTALTPGLCTAYDAAAHADLLKSYLSREKLHALTSHLVQHFKRAA